MTQSLNRDMYEQLVAGIAEGRKKSEAEVDGYVYLGCPALEILNNTFDFLAIEKANGVER